MLSLQNGLGLGLQALEWNKSKSETDQPFQSLKLILNKTTKDDAQNKYISIWHKNVIPIFLIIKLQMLIFLLYV